jgi:hypothetical protein
MAAKTIKIARSALKKNAATSISALMHARKQVVSFLTCIMAAALLERAVVF